MARYLDRVTVPSSTGMHEIIFRDYQWKILRQRYGRNFHNVTFLITSWTTLLADSPISLHSLKPKEVYNRFFSDLNEDLFGVIERYSDLADKLVKSLERTDSGISIDPLFNEFKKTPIFREFHEFFKSRSPSLLQYILSFLSFGSKLYYEDKELDAAAFRGWLSVEDRLGTLELPDDLLRLLRRILHVVFEGWSPGAFLPKHGNGRVAEQGISNSNQKNADFPTYPTITYLFGKELGGGSRVHPEYGAKASSRVSRNISRLKFVPKNWKKTRSICMEPVLFQWAQQGVRLWYEHHLSTSILRRAVTIQDQTGNQLAACFGSEFGTVDTIDLSSASDSVSWVLVKRIFPAKVCKYLAATRTRLVEVPDQDEPVMVHKFAPMGSALCFPVQSTIYSAVVYAAGIAATYDLNDRLEFESLLKRIDRRFLQKLFKNYNDFGLFPFQPFRVYGDDIITDSRLTSIVVRMLRQLGFEVNNEKSFVGNQAYRESCGKHYFDGFDVTPFYFRVKKIGEKVSIATVSGIIDAANRAKVYGYVFLRRHLIRFLRFYPILNHNKRNGVNQILYSDDPDESNAILCDRPTNKHLLLRSYDPNVSDAEEKRRTDTCQRYQRDELRSITITKLTSEEVEEKFDNYHYVAWQRSCFHRAEATDISQSYGGSISSGTRVSWRWTPA